MLVVEDKLLLADDVARMLAAQGATVRHLVATPGEGVGLVESEHMQAAVLDICREVKW